MKDFITATKINSKCILNLNNEMRTTEPLEDKREKSDSQRYPRSRTKVTSAERRAGRSLSPRCSALYADAARGAEPTRAGPQNTTLAPAARRLHQTASGGSARRSSPSEDSSPLLTMARLPTSAALSPQDRQRSSQHGSRTASLSLKGEPGAWRRRTRLSPLRSAHYWIACLAALNG